VGHEGGKLAIKGGSSSDLTKSSIHHKLTEICPFFARVIRHGSKEGWQNGERISPRDQDF
jgi:hypothetical protein